MLPAILSRAKIQQSSDFSAAMYRNPCAIVPPYLLEALAESDDSELQQDAIYTLEVTSNMCERRYDYFNEATPSSLEDADSTRPSASIVPDYLLEQIATAQELDQETKESAAATLPFSRSRRQNRVAQDILEPKVLSSREVTFNHGVYDMELGGREDRLPGKPLRIGDEGPSIDPIANEAYDNCLPALNFFQEFFSYTSFDSKNGPVKSSIHYQKSETKKFANAIWAHGQMIYGDGNATVGNFTSCIEIIAHEITVRVSEVSKTRLT
jgi:Zn-dependent metalloprotease